MGRKPHDDMKSILAVWANRQFGQYMEMCDGVDFENEMVDSAIETMAKDIHRAASVAGQRYVDGSGQVMIKPAGTGPLGSRATIGAKIRTVMSATPEQFLAYAAFRLEDMRNDKELAERKAAAQKRQYDDLYKAVFSGAPGEEVKAMARIIDDDDECKYDY